MSDLTYLHFYDIWLAKVLKTGKIPYHVAFIMDGNRRYGQKKKITKAQAHEQGLTSLKRVLEWMLVLGVKVVSTFAFSIENFNRDKKEVDHLMHLAKVNLNQMAQKNQFLQKHSIKVNMCGNLDLLPADVKESLNEIVELTKNNSRLELNICMSYNSTFEVENAVCSLKNKVTNGEKGIDQIKIQDFENELLVKTEPDIIIRTSNEIRLSNFLLYQGVTSELCFIEENWPEMNCWSFYKIIMGYQKHEKKLREFKERIKKIEDKLEPK